jgi:hypothetical protein
VKLWTYGNRDKLRIVVANNLMTLHKLSIHLNGNVVNPEYLKKKSHEEIIWGSDDVGCCGG